MNGSVNNVITVTALLMFDDRFLFGFSILATLLFVENVCTLTDILRVNYNRQGKRYHYFKWLQSD